MVTEISCTGAALMRQFERSFRVPSTTLVWMAASTSNRSCYGTRGAREPGRQLEPGSDLLTPERHAGLKQQTDEPITANLRKHGYEMPAIPPHPWMEWLAEANTIDREQFVPSVITEVVIVVKPPLTAHGPARCNYPASCEAPCSYCHP